MVINLRKSLGLLIAQMAINTSLFKPRLSKRPHMREAKLGDAVTAGRERDYRIISWKMRTT